MSSALVAMAIAMAVVGAPFPVAVASSPPADRAIVGGLSQYGARGPDLVRGLAPTPDGGASLVMAYSDAAVLGSDPGAPVLTPPATVGVGGGAVVHRSADGTTAWYATVTASGSVQLFDVAADPGGTTYAVGFASGDVVVTTPTGTTSWTTADSDGFVVAFDGSGGLAWWQPVAGLAADSLFGAAAVPGGGVVVTGMFAGSATVGSGPSAVVLDAGLNTGREAVVARFAVDGQVVWARQGRGVAFDLARDAAVDATGNVYVTGFFAGALRLDTTPGSAYLIGAGVTGFAASYDAAGVLRWLTTLGTGAQTLGWGIDVDPSGTTVAVSGASMGDLTVPVPGAPRTLTGAGDLDGLVVALRAATGVPRWATAQAGTGADLTPAVAVGSDGVVYAGGWFADRATFAPGRTMSGFDDEAFVAAYGLDGTLAWTEPVHSLGSDQVLALTRVGSGLLAGGQFAYTGSFGAGASSATAVSRGGLDGFVLRLDIVPNQPPTALDATAVTAVGQPVTVDVVAGDADGDPLTFLATPNGPVTGTLTGSGPTFTYTPAPGFVGTESFTLLVSDDLGGTANATLTFDTTDVDRPPVAGDLSRTVVQGVPFALDLPATDPDGDPLTVTVDGPGPSLGTLTGTGTAWVYTAGPDVTGPDAFTYTVDDGRGGTATGTVSLTVIVPPANRAPVPVPARQSVAPGATGNLGLAASDPDGDPVTFTVDAPGPAHGTLAGAPPDLTYTAAPDYRGSDTFTFTVADGRGGTATGTATVNVKPPNVVVVMSDDQTLEQQRFLPRTNALIGAAGTTFSDSVVSYSECCPARSTLLTGQYAHNHGVLSSSAPTGGVGKFDETNALPLWLQANGYYTSLSGKYLNGYGTTVPASHVPPGWDDWYALNDPTTYNYFEYSVSANGTPEWHGNADEDYSTDVLARHAEQVVRERGGTEQPLFVLFTPVGPHVRDSLFFPITAPRHVGLFGDEHLPANPAVNEADVSDKPAIIRAKPLLTDSYLATLDRSYRRSAQALQSVDEATASLVQALADTGELDNTIIVYTSDNGLQYGEHRLQLGKSQPYEESIRVPLLIRGPGFPAGAVVDRPTVNTDLAATIMEVTGSTAGRTADGVSLRTYLDVPGYGANRSVLLENGPFLNRPLYKGVRDRNYVYLEWNNGAKELYDRAADPHQLQNQAGTARYYFAQLNLQLRLRRLQSCAGPTCLVGVP